VTRTLALTTTWLLVAAAIIGAAYWGFLLTPESTIWSLGLSAVLLLVVVSLAATTVNAAVLAWRRGWSAQVIREAVLGIPGYLPPLLLVAAAWWVAGRGISWVDAHSGEISAWFIVQFGWSDVTWLFSAARWLGAWLRYVAVPLVALIWLRGILTSGWRPTGSLVRQALSPSRHLTAALVFAVLVWTPWTYLVAWRPVSMPLSIEMMFTASKLGMVALLTAIGVALIIRTAAIEPTT
jgi:hypothetical protein